MNPLWRPETVPQLSAALRVMTGCLVVLAGSCVWGLAVGWAMGVWP